MVKAKKGADKMLTVYWFVIIFIVAGAIVYMVYSFYGSPFDVRNLEGRTLSDQIANCLTSKGYLNEQIFSQNFQKNFLFYCNINFATEDFSDWKTNSQYYSEIEVYKFDPSQQSYGETGTSVSNIYGDQLTSFNSGNINLKTSWELSNLNSNSGILSALTPQRKVSTIVIHATEGSDAVGAIEAISIADLSVHYMINRDGTIISVNNENQFAPVQYANAFVSESDIGQHAGCYDTRTKTQWPACSPGCLDSSGLIANSCQKLSSPNPSSQCCIETNPKSIGIELVNLDSLCTGSKSSYCTNSVTADGKQWEAYSPAQINALVNLVSDIALRYNIPLDRSHIIGHYQVSSFKTDPGPAFPWDSFMQELNSRGAVTSLQTSIVQGQQQRSFYALDKNGNQYIVQVLTLIGKSEKNA